MIETQNYPSSSVTSIASNQAGASNGGIDLGALSFISYLPRPAYRFKPTLTVSGTGTESDGGFGRRLRKNLAQVRRHIDSISSVLNYVEDRCWQRTGVPKDRLFQQPHILYSTDCFPPVNTPENPIDCVTNKFVRSAMNKVKCPIYDIEWTPEGRRLITGASSGEFTLWNGTAFNFETILQAHDSAVRAMKWCHNDAWLVTADHDGFVKYWQANMNNVTMFQAHKEAVRSVSFAPSDTKFVTGSDDGTVRVWDFLRCHEERILRGHGSDVRSVDWHPTKGLLVTGSRDSQQPVKLWDPRTGQCLSTLHDHKNAVMAVQWNKNGNWFVSASRDHLIKLYDIRMMKELCTFKGHKKEVTSLSWHPIHESLLVSGGADGALMFWIVGNEKEVGIMETAHEQAVWTLKWHPLGHILASGSNDNNTKFWTRNKPGDLLEDFYGMVTAHPFEQLAGGRHNVHAPPPHHNHESPVKQTPTTWPLSQCKFITNEQLAGLPGIGNNDAPATSPADKSPNSSFESGIPGLGGAVDGGMSGSEYAGAMLPVVQPVGPGRKPLLKQPPPKRAQRQFERVWNVAGGSGSGSAPEADDAPALADMDLRKELRFTGSLSHTVDPSFGSGGEDWTRVPPPAEPAFNNPLDRRRAAVGTIYSNAAPAVVDLSDEQQSLDLGPGEWEPIQASWDTLQRNEYGARGPDYNATQNVKYEQTYHRHQGSLWQGDDNDRSWNQNLDNSRYTAPPPSLMSMGISKPCAPRQLFAGPRPPPPPPMPMWPQHGISASSSVRDPRQPRIGHSDVTSPLNYRGGTAYPAQQLKPISLMDLMRANDPRLRDPRSGSGGSAGPDSTEAAEDGPESTSVAGQQQASQKMNPKRKWTQDYEAEQWSPNDDPMTQRRRYV